MACSKYQAIVLITTSNEQTASVGEARKKTTEPPYRNGRPGWAAKAQTQSLHWPETKNKYHLNTHVFCNFKHPGLRTLNVT